MAKSISPREVARLMREALQGRGKYARDARAALVRFGLAVQTELRAAFVTRSHGGTDASGLRWAPLSPITIERRQRFRQGLFGRGPTQGRIVLILTRSGKILRSISPGQKPSTVRMNPPVVLHQIFQVTPRMVTIGTNAPHAAENHAGSPGRLPARPLWPHPDFWPAAWRNRIMNELRAGCERLGRIIVRT